MELCLLPISERQTRHRESCSNASPPTLPYVLILAHLLHLLVMTPRRDCFEILSPECCGIFGILGQYASGCYAVGIVPNNSPSVLVSGDHLDSSKTLI